MDLLERDYIEQLIKEYEEGKTLSQIAKKRKKSVSIIKTELLELGGEKGKEILLQELERTSGIPVMEIIEKYKNGKNVSQLKDEYNTSKISYIINQYQVITGEKIIRLINGNYREDLDRRKIAEDYRTGKKESELAEENKASISTIRRIITKYANENGYDIYDEHERAIVKKNLKNSVIDGLKMTSINSVCKILKKYRYGYEELFQIGMEKGYFVSKTTYERALELIEDKGKGEEIEW